MMSQRSKYNSVLCGTIAVTGILIAPSAWAFSPDADCDGAFAVGEVMRAGFVETTAWLDRLEQGEFVPYGESTFAQHVEAGPFLISAPWSFTPGEGTFRVRMETVVFEDLLELSPSSATLAGWAPEHRMQRAAIGREFKCGAGSPAFSSTPTLTAKVGSPWSYVPIAFGGSGAFRYSMLAGPADFAVEEISGTFAWVPTAEEIGAHPVILSIEDLATGRFDVQAFELVVGW